MGILGGGYLAEGYYEYNDFDGFSKIEKPEEILDAMKKNKLYRNDGYGMSKV